jgi:hypothetical protein
MSYTRLLNKLSTGIGFSNVILNEDQIKAESKDLEYFNKRPNQYWYVRHVLPKELHNLPNNKLKWLMVFSVKVPGTNEREIFRIPIADRDQTPSSLGLPVRKNNIPLDETELYATLLVSEAYIWKRNIPKWQRRIAELKKLHDSIKELNKIEQQIARIVFPEESEPCQPIRTERWMY